MTTGIVIGLLATPASGADIGAPVSSERSSANGVAAVSERDQGSDGTDWATAHVRLRGTAVPPQRSRSETCSAHRAVRFYRAAYLSWRDKMGAGTAGPERHLRYATPCPRYLSRVLRAKAFAARRAYEAWFERTYAKWECVHLHEGAWNDPNPPHYGGLQFDDSFQRGYGPEFFRRWGDAGNWPVWAQLIAAERAYLTRGFGPWPNTRRMCGV